MVSRFTASAMTLAAALALAAPGVAFAEGSASGDSGAASADSGDGGDQPAAKPSRQGRRSGQHSNRVRLDPYIEVAQIVDAQLSPTSETLTYSTIAAGVDASLNGRNNSASVSLRYERRFGYGKANDGDDVSGVARVSAAIVPQSLRFEAGAMAQRSRIESNGGAVLGPLDQGDSVSQIYSLYAGPMLATHVGDVKVDAHYRIGYTKVNSPDVLAVAPGQTPVDVFDHSTAHDAGFHAGVRPHDVLPVGLGVGGGYYQEDVSNLDQRVRDAHLRADVMVPVSQDIALVAGIGYEDVEISSRDAVRDINGQPVIGPDGRMVTDKSAPRTIAYEASGLIWDAGVMWRPSPRTALEAHIGRRYGTTSYYGTFSWAPNSRQSVNVSVYDNVSGFGGQVNRALANLPTQFEAVRNPLNGDLSGCVSSLDQGSCLGGVLGSVRSSTFRARGVMATYGIDLGRIKAGVGAGYDRRTFLAAPGTVLAAANGVIDENYWLSAYLDAQLDARSSLSTSIYANWLQSGFTSAGDATAFGATAAYRRSLTNHLSATAAIGIDGISRSYEDDIWTASALVGMRYSF